MEIFIKSILYASIFIILLKITLLEYQNNGLGERSVKNASRINIFGKNSNWIDKDEIKFIRFFYLGFFLGFIDFITSLFW